MNVITLTTLELKALNETGFLFCDDDRNTKIEIEFHELREDL